MDRVDITGKTKAATNHKRTSMKQVTKTGTQAQKRDKIDLPQLGPRWILFLSNEAEAYF